MSSYFYHRNGTIVMSLWSTFSMGNNSGSRYTTTKYV
uniref:Uncharacterized protein n=1 Tax=viral metagenome TaxID=1070528 RepID=A0A6C0BV71_9ZZZZ